MMPHTTKILFLIVSTFLLFSCGSNKVFRSEIESSNENLIYSALEAVYLKKYSQKNSNEIPDTIKLYSKAYIKGCYFYGLENFNFYYGFIDTTSFPALKLEKESLPYFSRIKEMLNDTIVLTKKSINVKGKSIHLIYKGETNIMNQNDEYLHLTPVIKNDNGSLFFGLINMDKVLKAHLSKDSDVLKCNTLNYYDDGSNMNPCGVPDVLRNTDFDVLFERYGITR